MPVYLFDLDGVLVDSRRPIATSINVALEAQGVDALPEAELHAFIGAPLRAVFAELLGRGGFDGARVEACLASYRSHYARVSLSETRLVAGIPAVLDRLREGGLLGVATSKPVEFARPILETLGLAAHFADVFGPPLERSEAKTETVGRALETLREGGARAVLVGDTRFDVEAARAHGIGSVGVTWGIGSVEELRAAGADHLVDHPAELLALLADSS